MVLESKTILIASAIFNVFMIICFSFLAVHCTRKYYALNKINSEQNKTISGQMDEIAEQNKTISGQMDELAKQSKKLDGLKNILLGMCFLCKFRFYTNIYVP